jgi:hypothetical protein
MVRRLTVEEKAKLKEEILNKTYFPLTKIKEDDLKFLDGKMVVDLLQKKSGRGAKHYVGEVLHGTPGEMAMILDYTCLRGGGSNIYHSFIYKAPKWRYTVKKADESLFVSPVWAEFYNITVAQKQKLEQAIKTGLTSAAQSVADYELLSHDTRRYKEIIDYFVDAEKTKDEHVIRSLFVDRVDAYTGEGYSMVTMARRWPTIITDFIRMKSEWMDVDTIRKELDVAAAEATVLKTKNMLYNEWKELFLPVVKERFARIENLARARKKSVEEYRKWLKPYIAKFRSMKEMDEKDPKSWVSNAYVTPGFGQSEAVVNTRLWLWKSISIVEAGKPPAVKTKRGGKWEIDPYDNWVKSWLKVIEYKYELRIEDKDVKAVLEKALSKEGMQFEVQPMYPEDLYYILFDMNWIISLLRTPPPEGVESDNLMIYPVTTWILSQNAVLLYMIELMAKEHAMEHYINEIIGAKSIEEQILKEVEARFKEKKEPGAWPRFSGRMSGVKRWFKPKVLAFVHLFIRPGPYEAVFYERVSKMYFRASGKDYQQVTNYLKEKMQIGK